LNVLVDSLVFFALGRQNRSYSHDDFEGGWHVVSFDEGRNLLYVDTWLRPRNRWHLFGFLFIFVLVPGRSKSHGG
jgi:hypothetical protein